MSTILPQRIEESLEVAPSLQDVSAALKTVSPELVATSSTILEPAVISRGGEIIPPLVKKKKYQLKMGWTRPPRRLGKVGIVI